MAREFLSWLDVEPGGHWLELGCGTGALTSSICLEAAPASVVACDQSAPFVDHARAALADARVTFLTAAADALPTRSDGFDAIVSGLVLNFLPDPAAAIAAMAERARPGGVVGAYVWDYSGGVEFLRDFWAEAVALDVNAAALDESRRFEAWQLSHVTSLFESAGLAAVESAPLTIPTSFATFEDFWAPFLGGTGPAPSYVASLDPAQRDVLKDRLRARLPTSDDGSLPLRARAWAAKGARR